MLHQCQLPRREIHRHLQRAQLLGQTGATLLEQRSLDLGDLRGLFLQAVRKRQLFAADDFGAQARDFGFEREQARLDFAHGRSKAGLIQPRENLPRRNAVAFVHQQLVQDAAIHGLNDLHATTGDDLAAGASHLVDLEHAGPDDERSDSDREHDQHRAVASAMGLLQSLDPPPL